MNSLLKSLRDSYHKQISIELVRVSRNGIPNFADQHSRSSVEIGQKMSEILGFKQQGRIGGQQAGDMFETLTCDFLKNSFKHLKHLRPGRWQYLTERTSISRFVQYCHLHELEELITANRKLATVLGRSYLVTPDIVAVRYPVSDKEINKKTHPPFVGSEENIANLTPFRAKNQIDQPPKPFLHASISCKWTIRSDRAQNTRTEALNLIRHRKGPVPHIVAVTAEPLPMRIASLALGTGDLDCVYHFALWELRTACEKVDCAKDQLDMLNSMIEGKRLRDISDLPLDLLT